MEKKAVLLLLLLSIPAHLSNAAGVPETAPTRIHLLKDIEATSITIAVGGDLVREKPDPVKYADPLVVYLGYSPWAWFEFGVALHNAWADPFAALDGKIDLVDIFADSGRISCLLMGGFGRFQNNGQFQPVFHGGVGVILQAKDDLQLYAGAGTDSLSDALSIQTGLYVTALQWLGFSLGIKLVVGPEGTEPMLSAAPFAVIH